MAVVITKSLGISNRDAVPSVDNNPKSGIANGKQCVGVVSTVSGDSVASVYKLVTIPSNCRLTKLAISTSGTIGTTTAGDIGLYDTTQNGGAVVAQTFFKSAQDFHTAALTNSDVTFGNTFTLANAEKMLWEVLGLASDPCKNYDVCITLTGACDGAAQIKAEASFVV